MPRFFIEQTGQTAEQPIGVGERTKSAYLSSPLRSEKCAAVFFFFLFKCACCIFHTITSTHHAHPHFLPPGLLIVPFPPAVESNLPAHGLLSEGHACVSLETQWSIPGCEHELQETSSREKK